MIIWLACSGTGGHIVPALALARFLKEKGHEVVWIGAGGMEHSLVHGFEITTLPMRPVRRTGILNYLMLPFDIIRSLFTCHNLRCRKKPDLVCLMGSYVTFPVGLYSWCMRVPFWIFEQNTTLGMVNRLLQPMAKKIFTGLPLDAKNAKETNIGSMINAAIKPRWDYGPHKPLHLLIMGGSRGARSLNQLLPLIIAEKFRGTFTIKHISGEKHYQETYDLYHSIGLDATVIKYSHDMPSLYQWADCAVARSGAMTVSELATVSLPAIFVPFPFATDDHQAKNAALMVERKGAVMVRSGDDFKKNMITALQSLDRDSLMQMHSWLQPMDFSPQWDIVQDELVKAETIEYKAS